MAARHETSAAQPRQEEPRFDWTDEALQARVRDAVLAQAPPEDAAGETEWRLTHISAVLLAGGHVYKFKRPVNLGFIDAGTLERRKALCEAEVRLNRRLAGDVYLGVPHHNSDVVRKELAGARSEAELKAPTGEGIYTREWTERTYAALLERAEATLSVGNSVILDATFSKSAWRRRARELAERLGARAAMVECRLDEAEALARLERRHRSGASVSDGRPELYAQQRAAFEPVTEFDAGAHLVADTARPTEDLLAELVPALAVPPPLFSQPG